MIDINTQSALVKENCLASFYGAKETGPSAYLENNSPLTNEVLDIIILSMD